MEFDAVLCCGCGACANVCPTDAISWIKNDEGFSEPHIDQGACVDCGLCRKVCPYETSHVGVDASPKVYAALHRDLDVVMNSSSGGVFTALSDHVLDQGGVVYGVAFDDAYEVRYVRASDRTARDAFRGSKYVQCDGEDMFSQVEKDLADGLLVMFTGTPCQVSGLKRYLQVKKGPMGRLLTVDNICHGVASPLVWDAYLAYIRSNVLRGSRIERLSMRSKQVSWQEQQMACVTDAGDESAALNHGASWNKLYQTTYAIRPSCSQCRYTSYDRVSDLTLADYWNIENAKLNIDYAHGVNLVLVNTRAGEDLLDSCADLLQTAQSDKASCWQVHLEKPLPLSAKRDRFWRDFGVDPQQAVKAYGKGSRLIDLARKVTPVLRRVGLYSLAVRVFSAVRGTKKA